MEAPRIPFRERSASIAVLVFHSLNLSTEISINPIGSSCRNMGPVKIYAQNYLQAPAE